MTPELVAQAWSLEDSLVFRLKLDFVSGIFFFLTSTYSITSKDACYNAATHAIALYSFEVMESIGKSLPTYHNFKSTYPEYFI